MMCQSTLAIYCFIDDFLKSLGHRQDVRALVTDAEVITIAIVAMLYFGANFEKSRLVLTELGLMKRMLSRSRLNRRLHHLSDLIDLTFHRCGAVLKDFNYESCYLIDSFPVAVCDNIRIKRCRIVRDETYHGRIQSKRRYFYGVRAQVMMTIDGTPVEFCILPGGCHDLQGLAELAHDLPPWTELFADNAYTNYEWEEYLLEVEQIRL